MGSGSCAEIICAILGVHPTILGAQLVTKGRDVSGHRKSFKTNEAW